MTLELAGVGAYAPQTYVTAETIREAWGQFGGDGIQQTSVTGADEDTLTMGYEAATRALSAADIDAEAVTTLIFGTTTPPNEEESATARLASFLGLTDDVATTQLTGSANAGVNGLTLGLDAGPGETALVVASDAPLGAPDSDVEHAAGAGAAAVVLSEGGTGVVTDRATHTATYPGTRFRPAGESETRSLGVTQYDRQAYREAVSGAVSELGADTDVDAAAVGGPDGKLPYRATGELGVDAETIQAGATVHELGDTGAAMPLLGLTKALDNGADRILVVGYGSGSEATAAVIDGSVPTESDRDGTVELSYGEYLRIRGVVTPGEPDGGGAYVSVPSWRRTLPQRHRLVAGQCAECESLAFPPEGACSSCGTLDSYESVALPGTGTVEAATVIGQGGAPPEFVEQQARDGSYVSAVVALDAPDGGTVSAPMQVVDTDEKPAIGDALTATIRRVYTQEGVTRYGTKMRPADSRQ
ncbi:3-hydroxy-3-methylglutaryl-CoA synthase [Halogeometricum borinquense DSM 11551]|uniref:3-hydroxy-3-methylglutaryl-CoA synthase n=2 Tax=Halogeometricum borinquense TaxID=60847 RepID=E4NVJ7_HALBP|nr:zinc ribbon domain-containing protein [Halogeometricum borinquense]ADQ68881.1 3-hydroxy-3-methylglutaryl CoA synthase [Halogeometricum borinquense DSM 11551]ELY28990.1 3-hydroxy-3-methylglutaryl-CoA synthase [Halogeometricum borinquense DSM 11551]RYJ08070.1 hydroxymethylglutaryl-CoA synthase family protein [Halogeometricum borinquense]